MKKVLFVCHGNICRSVMAEYIMKNLDVNNKFYVESRATSSEEIGNDIYEPVKVVLDKNNIKYKRHYAKKITNNDYNNFDIIYCMDNNNLNNLKRMFTNISKVKLLDSCEVSDPWYTRDFDGCFNQIYHAVKRIIENEKD